MKPRILITTRPSSDAAPIHEPRFREYVYQSDIDALRNQGAIVTLMPISTIEDMPTILSAVDGVVISGGRDIDPKYYGKELGVNTKEPHEALDASDFALLKVAKEMNIPTLGICRGMQALNVFMGGSLNQDIAGHRADHPVLSDTYEDRASIRHEVKLSTGSWLKKIFDEDAILTNSIHHQAVDRVGEDLRVVAHSTDGTIEAIESTSDWFAIGVQWHPELFGDPTVIFGNFVEEVSAHRAKNNRRDDH